jgi:hypothetical protein
LVTQARAGLLRLAARERGITSVHTAPAGVNDVSAQPRPSECFLHGDERREPWGKPFRGLEVLRCDHLGSAYVVEMMLLAGSEERPHRSHHIHFVRDGHREIHVLDDRLSQEAVERIWAQVAAAMERGAAPKDHVATFHVAVAA